MFPEGAVFVVNPSPQSSTTGCRPVPCLKDHQSLADMLHAESQLYLLDPTLKVLLGVYTLGGLEPHASLATHLTAQLQCQYAEHTTLPFLLVEEPLGAATLAKLAASAPGSLHPLTGFQVESLGELYEKEQAFLARKRARLSAQKAQAAPRPILPPLGAAGPSPGGLTSTPHGAASSDGHGAAPPSSLALTTYKAPEGTPVGTGQQQPPLATLTAPTPQPAVSSPLRGLQQPAEPAAPCLALAVWDPQKTAQGPVQERPASTSLSSSPRTAPVGTLQQLPMPPGFLNGVLTASHAVGSPLQSSSGGAALPARPGAPLGAPLGAGNRPTGPPTGPGVNPARGAAPNAQNSHSHPSAGSGWHPSGLQVPGEASRSAAPNWNSPHRRPPDYASNSQASIVARTPPHLLTTVFIYFNENLSPNAQKCVANIIERAAQGGSYDFVLMRAGARGNSLLVNFTSHQDSRVLVFAGPGKSELRQAFPKSFAVWDMHSQGRRALEERFSAGPTPYRVRGRPPTGFVPRNNVPTFFDFPGTQSRYTNGGGTEGKRDLRHNPSPRHPGRRPGEDDPPGAKRRRSRSRSRSRSATRGGSRRRTPPRGGPEGAREDHPSKRPRDGPTRDSANDFPPGDKGLPPEEVSAAQTRRARRKKPKALPNQDRAEDRWEAPPGGSGRSASPSGGPPGAIPRASQQQQQQPGGLGQPALSWGKGPDGTPALVAQGAGAGPTSSTGALPSKQPQAQQQQQQQHAGLRGVQVVAAQDEGSESEEGEEKEEQVGRALSRGGGGGKKAKRAKGKREKGEKKGEKKEREREKERERKERKRRRREGRREASTAGTASEQPSELASPSEVKDGGAGPTPMSKLSGSRPQPNGPTSAAPGGSNGADTPVSSGQTLFQVKADPGPGPEGPLAGPEGDPLHGARLSITIKGRHEEQGPLSSMKQEEEGKGPDPISHAPEHQESSTGIKLEAAAAPDAAAAAAAAANLHAVSDPARAADLFLQGLGGRSGGEPSEEGEVGQAMSWSEALQQAQQAQQAAGEGFKDNEFISFA